MEVKEITVKESWKSRNNMFCKTPEDVVFQCNEESIFPQMQAGKNFKAWCEPPQEGKKAWKILKLWLPEDDNKPVGAIIAEIKEENPQEIGLAWKICAELLVNGFIDTQKPQGAALELALKQWLADTLLPYPKEAH